MDFPLTPIHLQAGEKGCGKIADLLRRHGLRPTYQRVALTGLLFSQKPRHVSAEELYNEARQAGVRVSLATVYNTLHQLSQAKLLRAVAIEGSKTYFDTNMTAHHHFFVEDDQSVCDIPAGAFSVDRLPEPPEGMEITHVEVIIRVKKIDADA